MVKHINLKKDKNNFSNRRRSRSSAFGKQRKIFLKSLSRKSYRLIFSDPLNFNENDYLNFVITKYKKFCEKYNIDNDFNINNFEYKSFASIIDSIENLEFMKKGKVIQLTSNMIEKVNKRRPVSKTDDRDVLIVKNIINEIKEKKI